MWSQQALETDISKRSHASSCAPDITTFVRGEIQMSIKDGFIILLLVADAVWLLG